MSITGWENIDGFIGQTEADFFDFCVKNAEQESKFVEIGAWTGMSTLAMVDCIISNNKKINFFSIDHFEGSSEHQQFNPLILSGSLYQEYCKNIEPYKKYIHTMKMSSEESCLGFEDNSLDFVYIDAGHEYEYVKKDIDIWSEKVKPGGIISGHDWHYPEHDYAVQRAVIDFAKEKNYFINNEFNWTWYMYKR